MLNSYLCTALFQMMIEVRTPTLPIEQQQQQVTVGQRVFG
jgi:hypothetical protein